MENFDYRSNLVDSGRIVQCDKITNYFPTFWPACPVNCFDYDADDDDSDYSEDDNGLHLPAPYTAKWFVLSNAPPRLAPTYFPPQSCLDRKDVRKYSRKLGRQGWRWYRVAF